MIALSEEYHSLEFYTVHYFYELLFSSLSVLAESLIDILILFECVSYNSLNSILMCICNVYFYQFCLKAELIH